MRMFPRFPSAFKRELSSQEPRQGAGSSYKWSYETPINGQTDGELGWKKPYLEAL